MFCWFNFMPFLFLSFHIWPTEGGWVQGINHFVTNYRSQNISDFFLELYLILPLFLLLKNAPKKTLSTKMCPQAPRWPPKWVPNRYKTLLFSKVGHVCKQGAKKHAKGNFSQSLLEAFLSLKSEVISSLNSTCSCLYVYFSRTLPRRHLDTQMCPKAPKWAPKWVQNEYKTWLFTKVGNVCPTQ